MAVVWPRAAVGRRRYITVLVGEQGKELFKERRRVCLFHSKFLRELSFYAMHIAIASSLGVICFTSISSIRSHIKLRNVNFTILRKWSPGIVLGSVLGSYSASLISGQILVNIFILLAFLIALNMAFQKDPIIISKDLPQFKLVNLVISFLIGFMSVLIGIGGGSFSVPTLTMFSKKIYEFVGPICESTDKFTSLHKFQRLKEKDIIVMCDVGAYGMSLSSNYNLRPKPAELLIKGSKIKVIKKRQKHKDLM